MIKRANQKKKKGFSLIELIIVLAVMAIIALIAIPNFTAVRNSSKVKADKQSCETIERAMLMLTADETVKVAADASIIFTVTTDGTAGKATLETGTATDSTDVNLSELAEIDKALAEVNRPQTTTTGKYKIAITAATGKIIVTTP